MLSAMRGISVGLRENFRPGLCWHGSLHCCLEMCSDGSPPWLVLCAPSPASSSSSATVKKPPPHPPAQSRAGQQKGNSQGEPVPSSSCLSPRLLLNPHVSLRAGVWYVKGQKRGLVLLSLLRPWKFALFTNKIRYVQVSDCGSKKHSSWRKLHSN